MKSSVANLNTTCQTVDVPVKNGPAVFLHTHTALLCLRSHESMKALDSQNLDDQLYLRLVLNVHIKSLICCQPKRKVIRAQLRKVEHYKNSPFLYPLCFDILTNFSADASLVVIHERNASLSQAPATSQEPCTRQTRVKH